MGFVGTFKQKIVDQTEFLLKKSSGMEFPDKHQTLAYLNKYLISPNQRSNVEMPEIADVADKNKIIFEESISAGSRSYVWKYEPEGKESYLLRIGSVLAGNKVLQTDYGYPSLFTDDFGGKRAIRDFIMPDKRETLHVETLIAPWSQYFRKEYFLYVYFIAAKLCRMKDVLPEKTFNEAVVSYPLYNTGFEREFLDLLGFKGEQVIDSQLKKITFDGCILGNNDNWSYPNIADVLSLRKHVESKIITTGKGAGERIYICRSGRRRVLNEGDLIKVLEKFGFAILEDKPRSVAEQFEIYNNASFIMGPHGASFSNIVWCKPGAHLFELFPQRYIYKFFLYLAEIMSMTYSAYCHGPVIPTYAYKTVNDNIFISVDEIERYLNNYFETNP